MRLRRIPALHWLLAVCLAATAFLTVHKLTGAARARAAYWGRTTEVAVMVAPVAAGTTIGPADFERRAVPLALLPDSAPVDDPEGLTALVALLAGDVVVEARVSPDGLTGPAALLGPGERAVAVGLEAASPPLEVGDRVDLVATVASATGYEPATATVLARGALVVDAGDEAVTVAVDARGAPAVASASAQGVLTLVLSLPGEADHLAGGSGGGGPGVGGSVAGGGHGEHHQAGRDPVGHERGEAAAADEADEAPDGGEPGDRRRSHADPEGGHEVTGDPAGPHHP